MNDRALAFTKLNAALNGLTNVECRHGSLFEPVDGETFDLITCNSPYVVSPERRWVYRDAGFNADELSERVVGEAAAHLAEGGFATMLVSWLAEDEDEPDERAIEWAQRTGCDSWILSTWDADPLTHATTWNSHLDGDELEQALDEWTAYFDELGVEWISEGAVLLHKRPGGGEARVDSIEADDVDTADEQIRRAFARWHSGSSRSSSRRTGGLPSSSLGSNCPREPTPPWRSNGACSTSWRRSTAARRSER